MKKIFIIPILSLLCVAGCSKNDEASTSTSNTILTTQIAPNSGTSNQSSSVSNNNPLNQHFVNLVPNGNLSLSRLQEGPRIYSISYNDYPPYTEYTELELMVHDIDNEETDSLLTNGGSNTLYNKSTFYLHNDSNENIEYSFKISIRYNMKRVIMANIMRIRLFKNDIETSSHNFETYAKSSTGGGPEKISKDDSDYATEFISDDVAMFDESLTINGGATIRYTLVAWLEGWDPDSAGSSSSTGVFELTADISEISSD